MTGSNVHETEMSTPKYVTSIFIFPLEGHALTRRDRFEVEQK